MVSLNRITGKSRVSSLVLGFYGSVEHAEEALHEVRKNRFRRSAVVHCTEDGRFGILYAGLSPYSRGAFAIAVALVFVILGEILRADRWEQILLASCGFLITWFGALYQTTRFLSLEASK